MIKVTCKGFKNADDAFARRFRNADDVVMLGVMLRILIYDSNGFKRLRKSIYSNH